MAVAAAHQEELTLTVLPAVRGAAVGRVATVAAAPWVKVMTEETAAAVVVLAVGAEPRRREPVVQEQLGAQVVMG